MTKVKTDDTIIFQLGLLIYKVKSSIFVPQSKR